MHGKSKQHPVLPTGCQSHPLHNPLHRRVGGHPPKFMSAELRDGFGIDRASHEASKAGKAAAKKKTTDVEISRT